MIVNDKKFAQMHALVTRIASALHNRQFSTQLITDAEDAAILCDELETDFKQGPGDGTGVDVIVEYAIYGEGSKRYQAMCAAATLRGNADDLLAEFDIEPEEADMVQRFGKTMENFTEVYE